MIKKLFIFFLFILLIGFTNAATLSISPPQINFIGKVGENICQQIFIEVEGEENLTGKTLWAEEGYLERKLNNHIYPAEDYGLEIVFPKEIKIENSKEIQICLEGRKGGNYHGAFLYKIQDKPIQVGVWMNVNLSKENSIIGITGHVISKTGEGYGIFIALGIVLFLLLLILIIKYFLRN